VSTNTTTNGGSKRVRIGTGGTLGPPASAVGSRSKKIERAGFDLITWPDHLMGWLPESLWTPDVSPIAAVSPSNSPHVFLDAVACVAMAAASTDRVMLGPCVTDPIRRHPAVLANEFLTLSHMGEGRVFLGIGAGEGENTIPYGMNFDYQVSKLAEALQVIRLLWEADGPVDFDGKWFPLSGAVLGLGPYDGTYPPIWVGAHGPKMCELTGTYADGWVPVMMPIEDWKTRLGWIEAARERAGRQGDPFTPAVRSYVVAHEDHETAHRLLDHPLVKGLCLSLPDWLYKTVGADHPMGDGFHGLSSYIPSGIPKDEALTLIDRIPFELVHQYMLHGTPDDLVEGMTPYVDAGASLVILHNMGFLADPSTSATSFRLLVDTVRQVDARFNRSAAQAIEELVLR
jgi:phthiodiolone/phenolphthiodiolone dimycocerosates ketoreductase